MRKFLTIEIDCFSIDGKSFDFQRFIDEVKERVVEGQTRGSNRKKSGDSYRFWIEDESRSEEDDA